MSLLIVALAMLFAGALAAHLIIRARSPEWPPPGMPPFPVILYLSTFLIIGSSMVIQLGLSSIAAGREAVFKICMLSTMVIGILFLVCQGLGWRHLSSADVYASANLYAFTFYMLTVTHFVHVIGGLIPLGLFTYKSYQGKFTQQNHQPVALLTRYWHFLGIVWVILFLSLVYTG